MLILESHVRNCWSFFLVREVHLPAVVLIQCSPFVLVYEAVDFKEAAFDKYRGERVNGFAKISEDTTRTSELSVENPFAQVRRI
jgi:hypothetical protein